MSEKKIRCINCKHLKELRETDWSNPSWPLTFECAHPDYGGVKMSDLQKLQYHDCDKFEPKE